MTVGGRYDAGEATIGGGEGKMNWLEDGNIRPTTKACVAWAVKIVEDDDHSRGLLRTLSYTNASSFTNYEPSRSLNQWIEVPPAILPMIFFLDLVFGRRICNLGLWMHTALYFKTLFTRIQESESMTSRVGGNRGHGGRSRLNEWPWNEETGISSGSVYRVKGTTTELSCIIHKLVNGLHLGHNRWKERN
jgi:hypothetical protein